MKTTCPSGFDANDAVEALRRGGADLAHVHACDACSSAVSGLALVKAEWRRSLETDERHNRAASERKLASTRGRLPRSASRQGVVPVALALAAVLTVYGLRHYSVSTSMLEATTTPAPAATMPSPAAPTPAPATQQSAAPTQRVRRRVVVARGCPGCSTASGNAPMTTEPLDGSPMTIAARAHLILGWSVEGSDDDGSGRPLVDPHERVDVSGPAVVRAGTAESSDSLVLVRGEARAESAGAGEVWTTLARSFSRGAGTKWRVVAWDARTRVEALAGEVEVDALGEARERAVLRAGERLDVLPDGTTARVNAVHLPRAKPRASLDLEPAPPAGTGSAVPSTPYEEFERAEIELARADVASARSRLRALLGAADLSLAEDAALLLARSYPRGRARAEVWASVLASSPAPALRTRALLELGIARAEAGDVAGARQALDELERERPALSEPLEHRLQALKAKVAQESLPPP